MRPQTNGMFERFNARIEDFLQSNRFRSGKELERRSSTTYVSTMANYRNLCCKAERPSKRSRIGIVRSLRSSRRSVQASGL